MTLDIVGLILITAGWALQALSMTKKNTAINQGFLILYSGGIVLLVITGLSTFDLSLLLNVVSALLALSVLFRIYK